MQHDHQKPNFTNFIVLTTIALPLIMLGVYGLSTPDSLPWLTTPELAWSMIAVGIMIDAAAMFILYGEIKRVNKQA